MSFFVRKTVGRKGLSQPVLPQGLLDFFKVTSAVLKDYAYHIYLEELNNPPEHLKGVKLTSKGFFEKVTVQDFPLQGKACSLKIKRRTWLNEETGSNVSKDWNLVANGTRMTQEFALFF